MQLTLRQRGGSVIEPSQPECADLHRLAPSHAVARPRQRGFTLIELMITVTIAVVLIMIAVPSFKTLTLSNKLTTTANDMIGAINTARMEAIKRNANTQFCSNSATSNTGDTLGAGCGTQTGAVVALTGGAASVVRAGPTGIADPLQLKGNVTALRFSGQGLGHTVASTAPYEGTVVDICTASISKDNHRVIKMIAGSILETTTSSGACP